MGVKTERHQRVNNLTIEWLLRARQCPSRDMLTHEFIAFCVEKGINRPQDKSLRHSIIIFGNQMAEEVVRKYYAAIKESKNGQEGKDTGLLALPQSGN